MRRDSLARIQRDINSLQDNERHLRAARRDVEMRLIVRLMLDHVIRPEEVEAAYRSAKGEKVHRKVPAKYCHPLTGETWSGRGKLPLWLRAEELKGGDRKCFLIQRMPDHPFRLSAQAGDAQSGSDRCG